MSELHRVLKGRFRVEERFFTTYALDPMPESHEGWLWDTNKASTALINILRDFEYDLAGCSNRCKYSIRLSD